MKFAPGTFVRVKFRNSWPDAYSHLVMWLVGAGIHEYDMPMGTLNIQDVAVIIATRNVNDGEESFVLCKDSVGWVYTSQLEEA